MHQNKVFKVEAPIAITLGRFSLKLSSCHALLSMCVICNRTFMCKEEVFAQQASLMLASTHMVIKPRHAAAYFRRSPGAC